MKNTLASALALTLWTAAPAGAALCALDVAPARTLLLPYFEVDLAKLDKPKKTEITTVTLSNHADAETLVHVSFWTDLAGPVVTWDIPIPPFGSQDIPLYEVFTGDIRDLPGMDPDNFGVGPPDITTEDIIARQTGQELASGGCLTFPRGDSRARGYITFDVVDSGGTVFPPARARTDHLNLITGVVSYNNRKRKYGALEYLVHIEETEGLGRFWAADYDLRSGSKTELVVWRDPSSFEEFDFAAICDGPSENGWYPLGQIGVAVADVDGNMSEVLANSTGGGVPGFPLATGIYELGSGDLALPHKSGTIYLDLSDSDDSWVGVRRSFSASKRQGRTQAIPVVPIECQGEGTLFRTRRGLRAPSKAGPSKRKLPPLVRLLPRNRE